MQNPFLLGVNPTRMWTHIYRKNINQVTLLFEMLLEKLGPAMYIQSSSKREDNLLVEVYSAADWPWLQHRYGAAVLNQIGHWYSAMDALSGYDWSTGLLQTKLQYSSFIVHQNCLCFNGGLMHNKWRVLYKTIGSTAAGTNHVRLGVGRTAESTCIKYGPHEIFTNLQ